MGDATLELVSYTDPYCTWCWGSEPMLRRLDQVYGGAVRLRFVMGGLVKDISDFYDAANDIGGPEFYKQVAKHWLEASERHGMPVYDRIWYEMADEFRSTYPASLAYKAAQLENGRKADRFLRKMREGAAALGKMIHRSDVQLEMAGAVGLDGRMLKGNLESGAAEREFRKDLADAVERGARGFPTFL
ncbi:MAG: DsbA family protein, partial [Terriglobia bacterium]